MNTELVDKYVNGDIDDAAFSAELDKLDPEVRKAAVKEAEDKSLAKVTALRKARREIEEDIERKSKLPAEGAPPSDFVEKYRTSQIKKAMDKLFTDFGIEDAERSAYEEDFKKSDKGEVDVDLIFVDLKRIYGARNVDRLIASRGVEGAEDFTSRNAGAAASSGGPTASKEIDQRVAQLMAAARREGISMTEDEAKRGLAATDQQNRGRFSGLKPLK